MTLGKIDSAFFDRIIAPRLGAARDTVRVGPQNGVDTGVVAIGGGQVMVMTTDPFFVVPDYGWEKAGWFAVHILASDLTTSGLPPQFMSIDLNLPPSVSDDDLEALWDAVHCSCTDLGIAVVTGHTGRYQGCAFPFVGGCTLVSVGAEQQTVVGGLSRPGDDVLITKGAAIEAAGLMAATYREQVEAGLGGELAERAQSIFWQMSTVDDALTAASVGVRDDGVTAMHDATEGGVFGGLLEVANAAGVGMRIDVDAIPIPDDIAAICQLFDMDPYTSISEGTLLLTCRPQRTRAILDALAGRAIDGAHIGVCTEERGVQLERDGTTQSLAPVRVDPFWGAFARAAER